MSKTQESSPQGPTNGKWISTGASHVRPPRFDCYFFFYDEVTIREPEDGFLRKSSSLRAPTTTTTSHNCVEPPIEPITMKRKLEQNGVPSGEADTQKRSKTQASAEEDLTFADLGLDARLVQAVAEQNFLKPTLVQRQAIPLALNGKDVLCKSKTGSGKTAAYVLPLLNGILKKKSVRRTSRTDGDGVADP